MLRLNWLSCSFDEHTGFGRQAAYMIKGLLQEGHTVKPFERNITKWAGWMRQASGFDTGTLTIWLDVPKYFSSIPSSVWGYSMYETTKIPDEWVGKINKHTQRIIVPTSFCADVFREAGVKRPIIEIPLGIDPALPQYTGIPDRPYTFLVFGDRGERKNHSQVLWAFQEAFKGNENVRLLIKVRGEYADKILVDYTASKFRATMWREDIENIEDVFGAADCLVFASKGEGYGLPPREFVATGKPAIVTNWGGLADNNDKWATIPLNNYTMVKSHMGGQWSQPDTDEIIAAMRYCYENRETVKAQAEQGAAWLRANQTWAHSVTALRQAINQYHAIEF